MRLRASSTRPEEAGRQRSRRSRPRNGEAPATTCAHAPRVPSPACADTWRIISSAHTHSGAWATAHRIWAGPHPQARNLAAKQLQPPIPVCYDVGGPSRSLGLVDTSPPSCLAVEQAWPCRPSGPRSTCLRRHHESVRMLIRALRAPRMRAAFRCGGHATASVVHRRFLTLFPLMHVSTHEHTPPSKRGRQMRRIRAAVKPRPPTGTRVQPPGAASIA